MQEDSWVLQVEKLYQPIINMPSAKKNKVQLEKWEIGFEGKKKKVLIEYCGNHAPAVLTAWLWCQASD